MPQPDLGILIVRRSAEKLTAYLSAGQQRGWISLVVLGVLRCYRFTALNDRFLNAVVACGLIFPLFFTLSGNIYRSPIEPMYDSGGVITAVPLPVSLLFCFGALFLARGYREAKFIIAVVAAFVVALLLGDAVTGGWGMRKLAQNAQYAIPAGALVLGFLYRDYRTLVVTWLVVIACVIVAQIGYGYWAVGSLLLHHDLGLFSIYQHRQFIPVYFVAAYLLGIFSLWDDMKRRWLLVSLGMLVAFYIGLAISTLPSALLVFGVIAFSRKRREARWLPLIILGCLLFGAILVSNSPAAKQKYAIFTPHEGPASSFSIPFLPRVYVPINIERRLSDWKIHGAGIVDGYRAAAFGHAQPMDRKIATSAHNYYLDLAYNSGILALLPILILIAYTLWLLRRPTDLETYGLAFVVLFLVVLDNNFKVTFKQPYPGILGFFLWGLLLYRLRPALSGV